MLDQHEAVADFLKSKGYEEGKPVDNPRLDQELRRTAKHFSEKTAATFVADYFRNNTDPTIQGCEEAARNAGYTGYRDFIRDAYHVQNSQREVPVKQGRKKLPNKAAEI